MLKKLTALLATSTLAVAAFAQPDKPNIIVILGDDIGFSDLGCMGGEIDTPNLDSLAAGGVRFTQFYNTARCCPTRASLLTGLYPHQAGVGYMTDNAPYSAKRMINEWYQGDLRQDAATIAEVVKAGGYSTYMVGKWHLTKNQQEDSPRDNWPLQRGFDRFYGILSGASNFFEPEKLMRGNTWIDHASDPEYPAGNYYITDAFSDHAVTYIREHAGEEAEKPFFMYLSYTAAHWPMHAKPEDIAKYKGKYDEGYGPIRERRIARLRELGIIDPDWDVSPQFGDWDQVERKDWEARCMEVYAAMIDNMDQGIGRVIDELKATGQYENTLILYLQDNGACAEKIGPKENAKNKDVEPPPMPGPADTYIAYGEAWANVSNTPYRLYKHYTHEGGISTPLIAHWPATIKRHGEIDRQPGHLIDIMATIVDLSGAPYPKTRHRQPVLPMEGVSLAPAFAGKQIDRDAIFWEHEGNRALRIGKWKLVAKGPDTPWELYNIEQDRAEMNNLADTFPKRVKQMAAQWEAIAKRTHAKPWPWTSNRKAKPKKSQDA